MQSRALAHLFSSRSIALQHSAAHRGYTLQQQCPSLLPPTSSPLLFPPSFNMILSSLKTQLLPGSKIKWLPWGSYSASTSWDGAGLWSELIPHHGSLTDHFWGSFGSVLGQSKIKQSLLVAILVPERAWLQLSFDYAFKENSCSKLQPQRAPEMLSLYKFERVVSNGEVNLKSWYFLYKESGDFWQEQRLSKAGQKAEL